MPEYNVYPNIDHDRFVKVCRQIYAAFPEPLNWEHLVDVDTTEIGIITLREGEIKVFNDCEVGAIYVESDVEIPAEALKIE